MYIYPIYKTFMKSKLQFTLLDIINYLKENNYT